MGALERIWGVERGPVQKCDKLYPENLPQRVLKTEDITKEVFECATNYQSEGLRRAEEFFSTEGMKESEPIPDQRPTLLQVLPELEKIEQARPNVRI